MAVDHGCKCVQACTVEWNEDARELLSTIGAEDITETKKYHFLTYTGKRMREFVNSGNFLRKGVILEAKL